MTEITDSIKIHASVDKVFAYTSDYRNWSVFYKGIHDVKPITEETSATGSKFIYKTKSAGMTFSVGTEFRDFKKNHGWNGKSFKGVKHRTKWVFEETEGGTNFTHGVAYSLPWYYGENYLIRFL
jgi:hypothetical protein